MTDQAIEQEIKTKGLTAPRITPDDIAANISSEHYFTAADGIRGANNLECERGDPLTLLTFCVIELRNGFTVTGESACASPENFDAELGRKIARQNAVAKIWPLLGFALNPAHCQCDLGYLVEYIDGGQANTEQFAGYVSWSPKDVFERAYRPTQGMTFGLAIEALKQGAKVARAGWNGKGMWLSLSGGMVGRIVQADQFWSCANHDYAKSQGGCAHVLPCITMKTATGEILMGWLASQTDMLADDWAVIP